MITALRISFEALVSVNELSLVAGKQQLLYEQ